MGLSVEQNYFQLSNCPIGRRSSLMGNSFATESPEKGPKETFLRYLSRLTLYFIVGLPGSCH